MKRLLLRAGLPLAASLLLAGCPGKTTMAPATLAAPVAPFADVTAGAGLDFKQRSGGSPALNIIQIVAGGCAMFDYDGDGWLDLYLVQGEHAPGVGGGNRLYRNRQDGTFEDATERAGVRGHGYGIGCAVGDLNGDGRPDLYVCNYGRDEVYLNRGDGTFAESAKKLGINAPGFSVAAVMADLDADRRPDLYVTRYVKITPKSPMLCRQSGVLTTCGPALYDPEPGIFFHQEPDGRFTDRTRAAGLVNPGRGMSAAVMDVDANGTPDLFVANDTTANAFFRGQGGGKYREAALDAGVAYGDMGVPEANMGCDFGDYNGDGRPDLLVGVMQDRMTLLFQNTGQGLFDLVSRETGLAEPTREVVTFGCGFLDFDNDGDLDIFQANGHIHDRVQEINPAQRWAQPRQLLENQDGRFVDRTAYAGPALTAPAVGRGTAFGDVDNDGDVDVLVNNLDGPPHLLLNQAERLGRHWLRVKLVGRRPDALPEGAVVELTVAGKRLWRHLHTAYSYASASDPRILFGLGTETSIGPLSIRWPDGSRQEVPVSGVDREVEVVQTEVSR